MSALEEFRFEIPAFTPETMPFDRLMEYLNNVVTIIGSPSEVHLIGIETASTQPVLAVPRRLASRARERVREVEAGGGSKRRRDAFKRVQRMVEEDGAGPAVLKAPEGAIILKFEPVRAAESVVQGVRQPTSLQGTLIRVGGAQENSTILLQDDTGATISGCFANRALAKDLAKYLYEPVRLSGTGTWMRASNGEWRLERMQVQSFDPLEDRSLSDVVRELRSIPIDWPADTLEQLGQLRTDH